MLVVLFGALAVCLVLTVPIGMCLAITSGATIAVTYPGTNMMNMLAQSMVTSMDSFPLMAIPFFMLVGLLMDKTGIAKSLVDVGEAIAGPVPGGLGHAAIIASMFFSAISGSGPAVVAAIGAIMIPTMKTRGYDTDYSASLVASASTIGPVIPPSIPLIIFGATVGVSVTKLFAAGFLPGILMGISLMVMNHIISKKRGYKGVPRGGGFLWVLKKCKEGIWAIIMPIIVLGGIYAGFFTPTESAVVGVVYSIIVGIAVYHKLTLKGFVESLAEAALMSATVMIIMGGATTFGRILTMEKVPEMLANAMLSLTENRWIIMLLINLVFVLAGMFLDTISSVVLLSPLFVPIVVALGFDVVHFGIIMCINLCIGFLTPPVGINLFVAQSIGKVSLESIIKETIPFLWVLLGVLVLVIIFPQISLIIPKLLGL